MDDWETANGPSPGTDPTFNGYESAKETLEATKLTKEGERDTAQATIEGLQAAQGLDDAAAAGRMFEQRQRDFEDAESWVTRAQMDLENAKEELEIAKEQLEDANWLMEQVNSNEEWEHATNEIQWATERLQHAEEWKENASM